MGLDQERLELRAPPRVAAGRERAERVAVIALAPRDDMAALRFAGLDEILARHLERRLDRLRTAAHEIDAIESGRRVLDQAVGEALGDIGGEEARMRIGERVELRAQGGEHVGMAVAEAGDGRASRRVEIAPAVGVDDLDAGAGNGDRHDNVCGAMQNMRHERFRWRVARGCVGPSYAPEESGGKAECGDRGRGARTGCARGRAQRRAQDQGRPSGAAAHRRRTRARRRRMPRARRVDDPPACARRRRRASASTPRPTARRPRGSARRSATG